MKIYSLKYLKLFLLLLMFSLAFWYPTALYSQDSLLTLQQAIEIGLKNNYDIRISNNESGKQENNNTSGNAGMLPELDANGTYSKSSNSLKQKYNTGAEVNRDASASTNLNASLNLGWTIFDGMKMFRTKEKLSEISLQSRDQLKIQIETSLQEIITAY